MIRCTQKQYVVEMKETGGGKCVNKQRRKHRSNYGITSGMDISPTAYTVLPSFTLGLYIIKNQVYISYIVLTESWS